MLAKIYSSLFHDARRELLSLLPNEYKSSSANLFMNIAEKNSGLLSAKTIVDNVIEKTKDSPVVYKKHLYQVISNYPHKALLYASWCNDHFNAPDEEKKAFKKQSKQEFFIGKNSIVEPASENQIQFLISLGHNGTFPKSKAEASEWIQHYKTNKHLESFNVENLPVCDVNGDGGELRLIRMSLFTGRLSVMLNPSTFALISRLNDNNGLLEVYTYNNVHLTTSVKTTIKNSWVSLCTPTVVDVKFMEKVGK